MPPQKSTAALAAALLAVAPLTRPADAAEPLEAHVQRLLQVPVADPDHRVLDMSVVEYPPGGSSKPHRHHAYVLVYVLEGALEMQITGQPLVHLKVGDTYVERPSDVHAVSRNASTTAPAKFLVVMLKGPPAREQTPPGVPH